jgi:uncharacterized protein (TIGR03435 family)
MSERVVFGGRRLWFVVGGLMAVAVLSAVGQEGVVHGAAGQVAGTAVHGQDVSGSWQGTLEFRGSYRYVLKISKADGGGLKALMYRIDWGAQSVPVTAINLTDSTLRFSVVVTNSSYEGKLSADGNSIAGTWKQDNQPLPMTFARATPDTAWTIPLPPGSSLKPMAEDADPSFEVATIKPSGAQAGGLGGRTQGRRFQTKNATLTDLLRRAYGVQARQIQGLPGWAETAKYDIEGQPDAEGLPSEEQWKQMLQKLLADRFKLTVRREKKEFPVYALVVEKDGPKLAKSDGDPKAAAHVFINPGPQGGWLETVVTARVVDLADLLMGQAIKDRQVVDQTGLQGKFDFSLNFTTDAFAPDAGAAPDVFQAVQRQLGLKLESTKAPVEVIVVAHVEPPSEN